MFCPKCKSEYREGFTLCAGCKIPLVDELPKQVKLEREELEYIDLEYVATILRYTDVALVKSVFEGDGIHYYIQGEDMGSAPGGMPARALVQKDKVNEAKALLKEYGLI